MGVVLYRKGDTHIVNKIPCELKVIDHKHFNGEPEPGWFLSVEDINRIEMSEEAEANLKLHIEKAHRDIKARAVKVTPDVNQTQKEEVKTEEAEEKENVLNFAKMSNKKIREHAEKAKIKNFKTARIETLKEQLRA